MFSTSSHKQTNTPQEGEMSSLASLRALSDRQNPSPGRKKWSKKFAEKVAQNDLSKDAKSLDSRENALYNIWARAVIAKRLSNAIKQKVRDKKASCTKSLLNLHKPSPLTHYQQHWDLQLSCEVCNKPAIFDCIACDNCNIVVHFGCASVDKIISEGCQQGEHRIRYFEETEDEPEKYELQCGVCEEFTEFEFDYYRKERRRLINEKLLKKCAGIINSRIRTFVARKKFLGRRNFTIACQSMLRRLIVMKKYAAAKRNRLRIIHLDIKHLPQVTANFVCWTAVDVSKGVQVFRYDKDLSHVEQEGFLFPGVSSYLALFLSFIRVEGNQFHIVAQSQLALRDINPFEHDQMHSLVVRENIQWMPQETRHERMMISQRRDGKHDNVGIDTLTKRQRTCIVRYNALSSFTSFGLSAHGPPVDVLRKMPEAFINSKKNAMPDRKTRWWLVLAELNILFYQSFGDTRPRYSCTIFDASVSVVKDSGTRYHACLIFPDKRKWDFEFENMLDMKRFVIAITECRKGMESQSIYFKPGRRFETSYTTNHAL